MTHLEWHSKQQDVVAQQKGRMKGSWLRHCSFTKTNLISRQDVCVGLSWQRNRSFALRCIFPCSNGRLDHQYACCPRYLPNPLWILTELPVHKPPVKAYWKLFFVFRAEQQLCNTFSAAESAGKAGLHGKGCVGFRNSEYPVDFCCHFGVSSLCPLVCGFAIPTIGSEGPYY